MASSFKPAFEVTHVESMQWNRCLDGAAVCLYTDALPEDASLPPIPDDVRDAIKAAISSEMSFI
jgi:hypothetical protein